MKAKKRPVRAVYTSTKEPAAKAENLLDALQAFSAEEKWSDRIDALALEAAGITGPPAAVELANDVRLYASRAGSLPGDKIAAVELGFQLGRAVERLNVQLNPKAQLVFAKLDEDMARVRGLSRARAEKVALEPPTDMKAVARFVKGLKVEPRNWAALVAKKFGITPRHARRLIKRTSTA